MLIGLTLRDLVLVEALDLAVGRGADHAHRRDRSGQVDRSRRPGAGRRRPRRRGHGPARRSPGLGDRPLRPAADSAVWPLLAEKGIDAGLGRGPGAAPDAERRRPLARLRQRPAGQRRRAARDRGPAARGARPARDRRPARLPHPPPAARRLRRRPAAARRLRRSLAGVARSARGGRSARGRPVSGARGGAGAGRAGRRTRPALAATGRGRPSGRSPRGARRR